MCDRRPDEARAAGRIRAMVAALILLAAACGPVAQTPSVAPQTGPASPAATQSATEPSLAPTATPTAPAPTDVTPTPGQTPPPRTPGATEPSSTTSPTQQPTTAPTATPRPTVSPRPTATPRPGTTPRPTVKPTPVPTPGLGPSILVRHGSRTSGHVALTFDMGGRVGDALTIVDWLVTHQVHASIFMTGAMADNVNTDAGRRVLAIVDAHPDMFTLGNHSYTHRNFRDLTAAEVADELERTEAAIAPYCSQALPPFFRPPSGGYDGSVLAAVGAAGYPYTITWDVDTIDWRPIANDPPGPTADQIVAKVLANAQSGSIVLMHLGGYETFDALPRIVAGLQAAGLDLVTLDELL